MTSRSAGEPDLQPRAEQPGSLQPPGSAWPEPGAAQRRPVGVLQPRTAVLLVSGFIAILLSAVVLLVPVPYAVLRAGPALNTLGEVDAKPLIAITGHQTYPTSGTLDLTTVTIFGGPGRKVSLLQAVQGWLDPSVAVVPERDIFPPGQTEQQSQQETQQEMVSSQESATVAALGELGITVPTTLTVSQVSKDAPAAGALKAGDVVLAVNGKAVADLGALRDAVSGLAAGAAVTVRVKRGAADTDVATRTARSSTGATVLGIYVDPTFHFPFQVKIQIENIGGPSAGTMFALGIIDKLTPGALTGGNKLAGTGTMDSDGVVGPIGGIAQKLVGARDAGAQWFLAPADNCPDVVGHVPAGLHVVRVATLHEARLAVEQIAAGRGAALPTCS